jgi:hypothetical protein
MALTGEPDGPPKLVSGVPATAVRCAMGALCAMAAGIGLDSSALPDERLLGERAALMGLTRGGRTSAGGASRLLPSGDGTVAITLSRPDDFAAVPALTARDVIGHPWDAVARWCLDQNSSDIVERAVLLGLAAGAVDHSPPAPAEDVVATAPSTGANRPPRVVDLSSLWAGPLCAHLLELLGADVVHVESRQRPDPTREVAPAFHRLLRGNREPVVLDFTDPDDIARLRDELVRADIVIEGSRPRALVQLGIDADAIVAESRHGTWVSITAYGRAHNRIGYGDDVAAAAGLLGSGPVFAGDAIADPLTGCHAAVAALSGWRSGGAGLVEITMYDVIRATRAPMPEGEVVRHGDGWLVDDGVRLIPVRAPTARQVAR